MYVPIVIQRYECREVHLCSQMKKNTESVSGEANLTTKIMASSHRVSIIQPLSGHFASG